MRELVDEIYGEDFMRENGFKGVKLDHKRMTVSGHSFGGITAITCAQTDQRFKACLPMDPWLFPNIFDWSTKEYVMPPTLIIKTATFEDGCLK